MGVWARLRAAGTVVALAAALGTQALVGHPAQAATPGCTPTEPIGVAWTNAGGNTSTLGPCTGEQAEFWVIQWETFANGIVFWTPLTGAVPFLRNPPPAAGSAHGGAALAQAQTRLGMPYVYGDSGPTSFDCSGLAQWAYRQIGVTIPRVTDDQAAAGNYVPHDQLQPGDLVFFDGNSHVGLYAGNDQVLHAPDVGQFVRYTDINWLGVYSTARRY